MNKKFSVPFFLQRDIVSISFAEYLLSVITVETSDVGNMRDKDGFKYANIKIRQISSLVNWQSLANELAVGKPGSFLALSNPHWGRSQFLFAPVFSGKWIY